MKLVRQLLSQWIATPEDIWVGLYRLLLDYAHGVPRITDSNRLRSGIWRERATEVERMLATAMSCGTKEVEDKLDSLMTSKLYPRTTQRMNPIGIAFACATVYLIERFAHGKYDWQMEARIGTDVFPNLKDFRRKSVDIVAFRQGSPFAVVSSKWGIRHDRLRDPQEEADTYKREIPALKFFVVTNEFDNARLCKLLTYPTIDGVFHVRKDLVLRMYGETFCQLGDLKDLKDLPELQDFTDLMVCFP
jgi:hypothetical protein